MVRSEMSARSNSARGGEDAEDEFPGWGCGVDGCALAGEDFQADAPLGEVVDGVHEVAEVAAETVEFPDQEGVAGPESFQARSQLRPVILFPRGVVFVELLGCNSGGKECVPVEDRCFATRQLWRRACSRRARLTPVIYAFV